MKYRPEIDGLRSVAVVPVILFHAGLPGFDGGFVGVDVFFVISGYLITTIIIKDISQGTFSLLDFYARRARRILPALIAVTLSSIPFAFLLMTGSELRVFFQSLVAVAVFTANIFFFLKADYFAPDAELNPMLHTWSLAVEEQFYIFFPLLLLLLASKTSRYISFTLVTLAILSLVAYMIGERMAPMATFYLLPTRMWELLAGAICALHLMKTQEQRATRLDILGLGLIGLAVFWGGEGALLDGFGPQLAVLGAVFVILYAGPGTQGTRVLSLAPMVAIGLVSYSAYLWHQPVLVFARLSSVDLTISHFETLALVALTFLLAALSWRFIEQPFRRRVPGTDWKVVLSGVAALTCIAATGLAGHVTKGFEAFRSTSEIWAELNESIKISPMRNRCHERNPERPSVPECIYPEGDLRFAVLGNSHGVELAWGLALELQGSGSALLHKTVSRCRVGLTREDMPPEYQRWINEALGNILNRDEIEVVILSFFMDVTGRERLQDLAEIAERIRASGKFVVVVLNAPSLQRHIEWMAVHRPLDSSGNLFGRTLEDWHRIAPTLSEARSVFGDGVFVIDPAEQFCVEGQCLASIGSHALFYDSHHMSVFAASLLAPAIMDAVSDLRRLPSSSPSLSESDRTLTSNGADEPGLSQKQIGQ